MTEMSLGMVRSLGVGSLECKGCSWRGGSFLG